MARVLVADDDADIRFLIEMRLQRSGHEVTAVGNGLAAWTCLQEQDFDLAILDNSMPELTGLEVTARCRADERLRTQRILMVTAFAQVSDMQQGLDAGADRYLVKPFALQELSDHVAALLD